MAPFHMALGMSFLQGRRIPRAQEGPPILALPEDTLLGPRGPRRSIEAMPPRRRTTSSGPAFTLELPKTLEARKDGDAWWVEVDGRELRLSNLNKVFWSAE